MYFSIELLLFSLLSISCLFCCQIPPSAWCQNDQIDEECNVVDQCRKYKSEMGDRKFKIQLLYETLCPDCQNFIKQQLKSEYWKIARQFVNFEFIPYGNARQSSISAEIQCQHGALECSLNKLHSCAIKYLADDNSWFPFIYCMEEQLSRHIDPDRAVRICFDASKIKPSEQKSINVCRNGTEGDVLQREAGQRTNDIGPEKHTFVPWLTINGASLKNFQLHQDGLINFLCSWYPEDKMPHGCSMFQVYKSDTCKKES